MKVFLFSIKDVAAGYSQPFAAPNNAVALRMFSNSVRSQTPNIANTNPEDKSFWLVGELDTETGILTSTLQFLAKAEDYALSPEEVEKRNAAIKAASDQRIRELEEALKQESKRADGYLEQLNVMSSQVKKKKKGLFGGRK